MMNLFPDSSSIREFAAVSYMGVPLIDSNGKILGNLAVLDNRPMPEEPRFQVLFRIFAARAAAELQRIQAAAEIRMREEKYRRIVETAGEGFILMDKNLIITDVNEALCQLVGHRRENIIGKSPLEFATKDFRQFMETNQKEISAGKYKEFEVTLVSQNDRNIPVLVHGSTLRDDQGCVIGNMAFVTNLSEQKKSLTLAAEVQKSLQPPTALQVAGLDVAGRTIACEEIGGDYFDFLQEQQCVGKRRFRKIIRENAHRSTDQIIDAVYNDLSNYTQGIRQADDITLVVIKISDFPGAVDDWRI
jgi:PAS domain S-box-containing protein